MENPFSGAGGYQAGVVDALKPNPPLDMPEALGAGEAMTSSPFIEAQDIDQIIAQLVLDRPLKLFIPDMHKYTEYEFHIINSTPSEIAAAHNKGWKEVTQPELVKLFVDLVAGTDKEGKAYRPMLCARPKKVGAYIRKQHRMQLASLYAGMDPRNKDMSGKYTANVSDKDGTFGNFSGANWRIKVV